MFALSVGECVWGSSVSWLSPIEICIMMPTVQLVENPTENVHHLASVPSSFPAGLRKCQVPSAKWHVEMPKVAAGIASECFFLVASRWH